MTTLSDLKDGVGTSTGKLVLLTVATAGLYPILWVAQTTRHIRDVTQASVAGETFTVVMAAAFGWSAILASVRDRDINAFGGLFSLTVAILYIVWAFKAKKVLEDYAIAQHKVDPRMNSFYTFFLNVFYVCYCINDLPDEQRKLQALNSAS